MTTTLRDFDGGLSYEGLIAPQSRTGYLIDIAETQSRNDAQRLKLLRCPACGAYFDHDYDDAANDPMARHLHDAHDPEDFGLSKRGERQ